MSVGFRHKSTGVFPVTSTASRCRFCGFFADPGEGNDNNSTARTTARCFFCVNISLAGPPFKAASQLQTARWMPVRILGREERKKGDHEVVDTTRRRSEPDHQSY